MIIFSQYKASRNAVVNAGIFGAITDVLIVLKRNKQQAVIRRNADAV